jgi:hypothetical protein
MYDALRRQASPKEKIDKFEVHCAAATNTKTQLNPAQQASSFIVCIYSCSVVFYFPGSIFIVPEERRDPKRRSKNTTIVFLESPNGIPAVFF